MKKTFFLMLFGLGLQAQMYVKKDYSYQSQSVSHTTMNATSRDPLNSITEDGSFFWLGSNVSKYLPNGSEDMTFGVNGSLNVVENNLVMASLIKVVNNNLYVYAYPYQTNPVQKVGKFGFNGVKNTNFGSNGILTFSNNYIYGFNSMVENSDQSLFIVASNGGGNKGIKKIDVNGVIDPNFISSVLDSKSFSRMVQLTNNNVLIEYYDSSTFKTYLKKYNFQGQEDNTFGGQGYINFDISTSDIVVNNSDEIYVLERKTGTQQVIKKYTPNGFVDTTFGTNGVFDISSFNTGKTINVNNIDFDSNGSVLLFGGTTDGTANSFIARINSNGSFDNTFHGNLSYFMAYDMFGNNLSGKVINDNEYICFNREGGGSLITYRSFKYIRNTVPTLDVKDVEYSNSIRIYPNPASDFINIRVGTNDKINKISIYTITGELVLSTQKSEIDIKHLIKGNYIVETIVNNKVYTSKLIKK